MQAGSDAPNGCLHSLLLLLAEEGSLARALQEENMANPWLMLACDQQQLLNLQLEEELACFFVAE